MDKIKQVAATVRAALAGNPTLDWETTSMTAGEWLVEMREIFEEEGDTFPELRFSDASVVMLSEAGDDAVEILADPCGTFHVIAPYHMENDSEFNGMHAESLSEAQALAELVVADGLPSGSFSFQDGGRALDAINAFLALADAV